MKMISSNRKNPHLLAKLYNRELSSQFLKGKRATHKPAKQLFNQVPNRLVFPLNQTIPDIGADILMGATKCGRFLVGYNFSLDSDSDLNPAYRYRLSIWSFVPGRQAKKVASVRLFEVTRFSYLEVQDLLTISIVQWPNVPDYLVVYGSCQRSLEYEMVDEFNQYTVFSTVTSLPSLACKDCIAIQQNCSADVLDVRCSKHGLTIHTSFSLSSYYEFNPVLSTSTDYQIVVNTGTFVHVIKFTLTPVPKKKRNSIQRSEQTSYNDKTDAGLIRNARFVNRLSYSFLTDNSYMIIISDFWVPKILSLLLEWIKLGHQIEIKDLPFYMKYAIQKNSKFLSNLGVSSEAASSIVLSNSNAHEILFSPYSASRPRWFSCRKTNRNTHLSNQHPDKIYDFAEDGTGVGWKFDSFRKWCLAKKVYEFPSGDEDHCQENIRPVIPPRPPRQNLRSVKEEARESTVARFVSGLSRELRPQKRKHPSSLRAVVNSSLWMGPQFEMADDVVRIMRRGFGHQPVSQFSVAKSFSHSFAEPSVLTAPSQPQQHSIDPYDDEVDLCLPVRLFGANYSELVRVPDSSTNLQWNVMTVEQTVLDVESVCYRAMEKVCQAENYRFKYLHDLDSDIVQTCPSSGDILLLFISRLVAKNLSAKRSKVSDPEPSEDDKEYDKMYDCTFIVIWSPGDQSCYLEGYSGLTEVGSGTRLSVVGQAVREAQRLRGKANTAFGYPAASAPRCTTHAADIGQFLSSTLLVDQDNLIGFFKL